MEDLIEDKIANSTYLFNMCTISSPTLMETSPKDDHAARKTSKGLLQSQPEQTYCCVLTHEAAILCTRSANIHTAQQ